MGLGAVQSPSQGQRAHLGPPVGPSPECSALRTVVLRTPPDAWFGKKRMVAVTWHLTGVFISFQREKAGSSKKGEESTAKIKRKENGLGDEVGR